MRIPPPWNDARTWLERRWGAPVGRIGVDGGFSCPNRTEGKDRTGCAFCSGRGNRPPYQAGEETLAGQIRQGKSFLSERYGSSLFSLYFQSFSSTWAPVETLRRVYDEALALGPFVDMTVGTRPDCVPDDVIDLLASYRKPDRDVWVELGLQSAKDETLNAIGRGHDVKSFCDAAARLRAKELPFTTHIMFGLPGENKQEFLDSLRLAVAQGTSGVKFHDLMLVPGTRLYQEWKAGRLHPVEPEEYLDTVATALAELPASIVVWRVCSDPEDRQESAAPGDKWPKNRFLQRLMIEVAERKRLQSSGEAFLLLKRK